MSVRFTRLRGVLGFAVRRTLARLRSNERTQILLSVAGVAVARALANDPDIVLADEPTGELDTDTGMTVLDLLAELSADRAVVVASHDDRVVGLADRTVRLRDGELIADE